MIHRDALCTRKLAASTPGKDRTESDSGLTTLVTWTLTPRTGGTLLRVEQSGFRLRDGIANKRMNGWWRRALQRLEQVADDLEG